MFQTKYWSYVLSSTQQQLRQCITVYRGVFCELH